MTHVAPRHDILRMTVDSLIDNMVNIDFSNSTIYINIDKIEFIDKIEDQRDKTKEYLSKIFKEVITNEPEYPNFSNALKWCWTQPKEELFFHIEDDWLLEKEVDIENIIPLFEDPNLFAVNLRAYHFSGPRPCLLQAIYRKSFCNKFASKLIETINPENSLRSYAKSNKNLYNIHYPEGINDIVLKDIGRDWLKFKGLKRNQISSKFVKYERNR